MMTDSATSGTGPRPSPVRSVTSHLPRAALGGALMGLANLVPGISGGTMLLAAGVYDDFIDAVSTITRFRLERRSLLLLLVITAAAATGILLFAGPVKDLVIGRRWIMYSIFVGLTLGGIPTLWRLAKPGSRSLLWGVGIGFMAMVMVALAQQAGVSAGNGGAGFMPLFVAGLAGAASMILPGISGGYLLLLLGQYVPILTAIEQAVDAVRAGEVAALGAPVLGVFIPVGLGMVAGVAVVSNLLRYFLRSHRQATLGVLLGLLAGVVVGLWPFQTPISPVAGTVIKGRLVTAGNVEQFPLEDWPLATFTPHASQAAAALGLALAGTLATLGVARLGKDD